MIRVDSPDDRISNKIYFLSIERRGAGLVLRWTALKSTVYVDQVAKGSKSLVACHQVVDANHRVQGICWTYPIFGVVLWKSRENLILHLPHSGFLLCWNKVESRREERTQTSYSLWRDLPCGTEATSSKESSWEGGGNERRREIPWEEAVGLWGAAGAASNWWCRRLPGPSDVPFAMGSPTLGIARILSGKQWALSNLWSIP